MKIVRSLSILLLSVCFFSLTTFAQNTTSKQHSYFLHTIKKGENIYSIASMYHVSQQDILRLNPTIENKILAGNSLRIPHQETTDQSKRFHTIQAGETLYQLTQKYQLSAQAICEANPGLSASNFKVNQVIAIPTGKRTSQKPVKVAPKKEEPVKDGKPLCREMHKIKRRDKVAKICKKYGITPAELYAANPEIRSGLKKGKYLCIPFHQEKKAAAEKKVVVKAPTNAELFGQYQKNPKKINRIQAAIILPFLLDDEYGSREVPRMMEYYEGCLIALDSLKQEGVSVDLYTYDSGPADSTLTPILSKPEMENMDIIFGPLYSKHIDELAHFAKKTKTRLVIPFSSKDRNVFSNPYIYIINTPQSYLYSEVYEHFTRRFTNANVIFIESSDDKKEKQEFTNGLKVELDKLNIPYCTLPTQATDEQYVASLIENKENIFIPVSASEVAITGLMPHITSLIQTYPDLYIRLFGYPEWQTYTMEYLSLYYDIGTFFYSSFYTNHLYPSAKQFTSLYRNWYGREMMNTYPKFGMLGFDVTYYFLKGLSTFGNHLEDNINRIKVSPVQTGFKFIRVDNWGGFVNKKEFFINFTRDFEIKKLNFE
ncbi:MAG: LysM domain-containing protein [Bacteroidaceae bacterium]|nr:LysM domain-containing protein [Bacteroidaceae bacterium]